MNGLFRGQCSQSRRERNSPFKWLENEINWRWKIKFDARCVPRENVQIHFVQRSLLVYFQYPIHIWSFQLIPNFSQEEGHLKVSAHRRKASEWEVYWLRDDSGLADVRITSEIITFLIITVINWIPSLVTCKSPCLFYTFKGHLISII